MRSAIVLSVGAPKARPQEQYALQRDRVYGSQAWSRLSNTVLVLSITGDGTVATRDLAVLHRNAPAEKFHLTFQDGLLVETEAPVTSDPDMVTWIRETEVFSKQRFREAFSLSGARTHRAARRVRGDWPAAGEDQKRSDYSTCSGARPRRRAARSLPSRRSDRCPNPLLISDENPADDAVAEIVRNLHGHGHEDYSP